MTDETTTPAPPDDEDKDEEEDNTIQGVAKRSEKEIAEAQRIQDELNEAAGITPADAPAETPAAKTPAAETPAETPPTEPAASSRRRTSSG